MASDAADGAAGVWALKKVGVEVVWTVGFRYNGCRGWKKDEEGAGRVGVIVSVLREEERGLVKPLVGMVKEARERVEGDEEELVVVEHRGEEGWRRFVEFGIEGLVGMRVRGEVVWVGSGGGGGAGF